MKTRRVVKSTYIPKEESVTFKTSSQSFEVLGINYCIEDKEWCIGYIKMYYQTVEKEDGSPSIRGQYRTFQTVYENGEVPEHGVYVGTAYNNEEAWHVYEII